MLKRQSSATIAIAQAASWNVVSPVGLLVLGAATVVAQPSTAATANISCQTSANPPAVVATVSEQGRSQAIEMINFLPEYFSPEAAAQNCQTAASTLKALYDRDRANYLASDTIAGKPTVCAVERRGMGCDSDGARVLFSFDRAVDPSQALYDMLGSQFKGADRPDSRTVSRIYTDIKPRPWWFF
jgi:hypothetical protein